LANSLVGDKMRAWVFKSVVSIFYKQPITNVAVFPDPD